MSSVEGPKSPDNQNYSQGSDSSLGKNTPKFDPSVTSQNTDSPNVPNILTSNLTGAAKPAPKPVDPPLTPQQKLQEMKKFLEYMATGIAMQIAQQSAQLNAQIEQTMKKMNQ